MSKEIYKIDEHKLANGQSWFYPMSKLNDDLFDKLFGSWESISQDGIRGAYSSVGYDTLDKAKAAISARKTLLAESSGKKVISKTTVYEDLFS